MTDRFKTLLKQSLFILLGSTLYALGTVLFVFPSSLIFGGTSGISVILESFLTFSPGSILTVLNTLLIVAAFIVLGKSMAMKTLIGSVLTTLFIAVLKDFFSWTPPSFPTRLSAPSSERSSSQLRAALCFTLIPAPAAPTSSP